MTPYFVLSAIDENHEVYTHGPSSQQYTRSTTCIHIVNVLGSTGRQAPSPKERGSTSVATGKGRRPGIRLWGLVGPGSQ